MAGGKETPRQKMIGMMYLVLTALLALQIKDSVLEKFVLMESGLEVSNSSLLDYNETILTTIQSDVSNQGSKPGDIAVQKTAENIRAYTRGVIGYIEQMKLDVGAEASGGDTAKVYKRSTLKKIEEPSNYLYERHYGDSLKAVLDAFPVQVNAAVSDLEKGGMSPKWMESIALDANGIKFYEDNQEEKKKGFSEFNFYKAPLASVLTQLTFYKNQIYSKEAVALNKLKSLVGTAVTVDPSSIRSLGGLSAAPATPSASPQPQASNDDVAQTPQSSPSNPSNGSASTDIDPDDFLDRQFAGIDYAQAIVLSESNIVTAGLDFNAQTFLTLGNSKLNPKVRINGEEIDVVNGRGLYTTKASAALSDYDANGLAKKSFEVEIVAEDGTGEEITRTTTHEYFVARPVIDVRSQSVDVLYLDCRNDLNINVPALGPAYQPSFRITGGTVTQGSKKGEVSIVPNNRAVKIDVSSAGQYIDSREFEARNVPLPSFEVRVDGNPYDANVGIDNIPSTVTLNLKADAGFESKYPDDANFFVTKGLITISSGKNRIASIDIDGLKTEVDLASIRSRMRSGQRLVVAISEISRVNYANKQIPIPFTGVVEMTIN
ncbi:type IX secretion system motor protein PorM/GldM [Roseivirga misakiensis]|uniref:Gliding motility protein GldM n=1 Tax=Roseivirga misakiensis TaxID=1563681 RepID=A0A1E5T658_9BACT|nr:GldM family protein [Roseivirga misakiensis]OEK06872.1 hypothetical protein BFP71_04240 [Roseivirga misakiensis]